MTEPRPQYHPSNGPGRPARIYARRLEELLNYVTEGLPLAAQSAIPDLPEMRLFRLSFLRYSAVNQKEKPHAKQ